MNKFTLISIIFLLILIPSFLLCAEPWPYDDFECFVPFDGDRSTDYNKLKYRIIGEYGDYRISEMPGHKHSGLDIKGSFSETVYSISKGTVTNIFRGFPNKTICIRHDWRSTPLYSVYIHVEDIQVHVGDPVTENTPIARIFNQEELEAANFGTPPHLHLEIRHNISDRGEATFKSMSIEDLDKYCMDPLRFFKKVLN